MPSDAYRRFIASMDLDYDQWHDGTGYDLEALAQVTPEEMKDIEKLLRSRKYEDWRVVEALNALETPGSLDAMRACLTASNPVVRLAAARDLHERGELTDLHDPVLYALASGDPSAFSQACDLIGWHKLTSLAPVLLKMCLTASGRQACHCAALLYYLHGLSSSPFDWNHRPFFLRFNTVDTTERKAAFDELCAAIKVSPESIRPRPLRKPRPPFS